VGNITFLMIYAVFDPSPLKLWENIYSKVEPKSVGKVMGKNIVSCFRLTVYTDFYSVFKKYHSRFFPA